ncbi:hypothetical protein HNP77_001928 [Treponema rectale]|uniref:Lipoprotein n=1 Tax=Treponema rectale TaxID=744512 RepID=A0A840SI12_9SPIR|nr:hypothetical protein [Treponema rectale]MBB5219546.1 hypothetical protein [Treponema rectale]
MKIKNTILKMLMIMAAVIITGCSKTDKKNTSVQAQEPAEPEWNTDDGYICILFGHGFEEDSEKETVFLNRLEEKFGFEENGGLILPVFYEKDLNSRIWNFSDYISDKKIKGIIILGAPANTHKVLSSIQDSYEEGIPYNIFSLFPTDNSILGQEMTSNIVLEYELSIQDETEGRDVDQGPNEETTEIIINAIKYMSTLNEVLPVSWDLIENVKHITGTRTVRHYVDSIAPIPSMNHFLIKAPVTEGSDSEQSKNDGEVLPEEFDLEL